MNSPILEKKNIRFNAFTKVVNRNEKTSKRAEGASFPFFLCLFKWYLLFHMGFLTLQPTESLLSLAFFLPSIRKLFEEHENIRKTFSHSSHILLIKVWNFPFPSHTSVILSGWCGVFVCQSQVDTLWRQANELNHHQNHRQGPRRSVEGFRVR